MTYLAYDPERVEVLRRRLAIVRDELDGLRTDDPFAADLAAATRVATTAIDGIWLPMLSAIVGCRALTHYRPVPLDALDSANFLDAIPLRLATELGWTVLTDPLDRTTFDRREARALGRHLAAAAGAGDVGKLVDKLEERRALRADLALIAADPELASAFAAELGDAWVELSGALASRFARVVHTSGARRPGTDRAEIEAAATHVGVLVGGERILARIDDVEPLAAALLVRHLPIGSADRARVSHRLLLRWHGFEPVGPGGGGGPDREEHGPNAGDLLFEALVDDPVASRDLLVGMAASGDLDLVFTSAFDSELAHRVAVVGTAPSVMRSAEAEAVVPAIVDVFAVVSPSGPSPGSEPIDRTWAPFLGDLVGPWLLRYAPADREWSSLDVDDKRDQLELVVGDPEGRRHLLGTAASAAAEGEGRADPDVAANLLGFVTTLAVDGDVEDHETVRAMNDLAVSLPGDLLGPVGDITYGLVVGWLGAGPGAATASVRAAAEWRRARVLTAVGAGAVHHLHQRLVDEGRMPPGESPPAPDPATEDPEAAYEADFQRWLDETFPGAVVGDDAARDAIVATKSAFVSAASAGADAAS